MWVAICAEFFLELVVNNDGVEVVVFLFHGVCECEGVASAGYAYDVVVVFGEVCLECLLDGVGGGCHGVCFGYWEKCFLEVFRKHFCVVLVPPLGLEPRTIEL